MIREPATANDPCSPRPKDIIKYQEGGRETLSEEGEEEETGRTRLTKATPKEADKVARGLVLSMVNLRIKQVLENFDLSQSFRAAIAVREAMADIKLESDEYDHKSLNEKKREVRKKEKKKRK